MVTTGAIAAAIAVFTGIGAGVGIKKLIDAKKVTKKSTEKTDKKSLLEKLSNIHSGKKSKNTTEDFEPDEKSKEEK